jgi:putative membrane protein
MKKRTGILFVLPFALLTACNNEGKDSVEKADSTNQAKMDTSSNSNSTKTSTISTDEESSSFLVKAADGGMSEVQLGQLAQEKGTSARVKSFGAMMVHDHSAANDQVKALASQRNVTLPSVPGDKNQSTFNDLSKKTGKDFDKAYIDAMVKDHKEDIDEFQSASKNVKDNEVKSFVDNTLPKLNMHLDSAQAIQKKMK